jgi:hypothetical protein
MRTAGSRVALPRTRSAAAATWSDRRRRQRAAAGVREAAPIVERRQAGGADRHLALAGAPRAPEGVGDDDRAAEPGAQRAGGGVGVVREQHERVRGARVGGVDAGVGAHEAVAGAADESAAIGAQDLSRLVEHHLHVARVLSVRGRECSGALARLDPGEVDEAALGLGDDLVRHGEDVARLEPPVQACAGIVEQRGEIVAGPDLG